MVKRKRRVDSIVTQNQVKIDNKDDFYPFKEKKCYACSSSHKKI